MAEKSAAKTGLFNSRLVPVLSLLLGALLLVSALLELRSTRRALTAALSEQATAVMALAQRGLENAALSYTFVEELLEEKLLDNARLLEKMDRSGQLTLAAVQEIADENHLFRINLFDADGRLLFSSMEGMGGPPVGAPRRLLQPILSDSSDELVLGFRQRSFGAGENFAVAKRRSRGGAIVVNADAGQVLEFRRAAGAGSFIKLVGESENVRYAVLQDSSRVLLASSGVTEMSSPESDDFLVRALTGARPLTRFTVLNGEDLLEIAAPAQVAGSGQAVLRIGLSAASLNRAARAAQWRIGLAMLLLLMTGILAAGALLRDLHERRRFEEHLKRQDQMTAMGHLASGVAHEIRNPLNAVSMIAQRLHREFVPAQEAEEYGQLTRTLSEESRRINEIVTQFLQFARPSPLNRVPTRPDALVSHVAGLMQGEAGELGITLTHQCREVAEISADADKLTQALLNLVRNSMAACSRGGRIELSCSQQGDRIIIRIEDDGAGIAAENLGKVFNLYFTTREEGSGLGLSIVQQIVSQHDGTITVESQPGKGTRFMIVLPARA